MTKFTPVRRNDDLDVHPAPPDGWDAVAVCCRWWDSRRGRREWPHASVVACLRTADGLDELLRNLLANPQIRVLVVVGPDLLDGKPGSAALDGFFLRSARSHDPADVLPPEPVLEQDLASCPALHAMRDDITYARQSSERGVFSVGRELRSAGELVATAGAPSREPVVLPPPPPRVRAQAPHGDPGERVAADTLAQVWPLVLRQAMKFGRTVGTQYGPTREYLDLVSVIRDPAATVADLRMYGREPHPILRTTFGVIDDYYRNSLASREAPEGATYGYGSRLHGTAHPTERVKSELVAGAEWIGGQPGGLGLATGLRVLSNSLGGVDQFAKIRQMLGQKQDTRAAFLTPWRPEEDSGLESGRPCLTGMWFRSVGTWGGRVRGLSSGREGTVVWWPTDPLGAGTARVLVDGEDSATSSAPSAWELLGEVQRPALHLTVTFRSHDLYGGYPKNLGALCMLLVDEAAALGMTPGTVTCVSFSAHVYERAWNSSQELVEEHAGRGMRWDQRSSWRVELVQEVQPLPEVGSTVTHELDVDGQPSCCQWRVARYSPLLPGDVEPRSVVLEPLDQEAAGGVISLTCDPIRPPPALLIRAIAMEPGGSGRTIGVFEARTGAALQHKIAQSGLVTEVSNALWLGSEIQRCELGAGATRAESSGPDR